MPFKSHRRRRPRRTRRRRHWHWLGLGALFVALAALLRRDQRPAPEGGKRNTAPEGGTPRSPAVPRPPDDVDSCWIAGPAGTLHVLERHPNGKIPVVFVHGLGGCAEHWAAQLEAAGPALRCVAFDLPGHGRSDQAMDGDYRVPATATAIAAVVNSLGLRRTLLVAHSLGASAAIEYADRHPERIAGLLLVDPSGDQTRLPETHRRELLAQIARDPAEEIRWNFRQLLAGARVEVADRVLEDLASVPADVALGALAGGVSYSPLPALERFAGPVWSLISDVNDLPSSLHNLLPDLPVFRFSRASHWLMLDRPDDLWAVLVDFLDDISALELRPAV